MVNANELRTGNYLNFNVIDKPFKITAKEIMIIEKGQMNDSQNYYFEPIPLSDQWLIYFGGEKDGNDFHFLRYTIYKPASYVGFLFCEGNLILREIKYVHQLQNLYFALIGEELSVSSVSLCEPNPDAQWKTLNATA